METKNSNDSDEGSSEKGLISNGFHAILHDGVHKKLMAFPSTPCHCIFKIAFFYYDTAHASASSTVCLAAKWAFFQILLVLSYPWYCLVQGISV